jgi:hypothetical protein
MNFNASPWVQSAAEAFGFPEAAIIPLNTGLIHHTFKISRGDSQAILQQINTHVFNDPALIVRNYLTIFQYLQETEAGISVPPPLTCSSGGYLYEAPDKSYWRAMVFMADAYTVTSPASPEQAYRAAQCFGKFSAALDKLSPAAIGITIPDFHNLSFRYRQFESACSGAPGHLLHAARTTIDELMHRKNLVEFYGSMAKNPDFRKRIMHHDAKITNILFDVCTGHAVCPVDLDTVMPGYFFSDLGDLVRSLAGSLNEDVWDVSSLNVRKEIYVALIQGYLDSMEKALTHTEKACIHLSGLLMTYMQALRFLTDYLMGNIYYRITYTEQNLQRANNQLALLIRLEEFVSDHFNFSLPYG